MAETDEYDGGEFSVREVSANGIRMKTTEVEAKLDQGNIEEAESSLREGLSLNFELSEALVYKWLNTMVYEPLTNLVMKEVT
ncbi:hypothetical protein Patl1_02482 [Pistacia atlantica]|uniref:Uncharacterized protein n=1 Tax=Pistacia atlantica TaxID=434234 RepID=A0ACC1CCA2_9ROSI|nr:hypothetical protein Patl1_02482 [Pistacia atlantica]